MGLYVYEPTDDYLETIQDMKAEEHLSAQKKFGMMATAAETDSDDEDDDSDDKDAGADFSDDSDDESDSSDEECDDDSSDDSDDDVSDDEDDDVDFAGVGIDGVDFAGVGTDDPPTAAEASADARNPPQVSTNKNKLGFTDRQVEQAHCARELYHMCGACLLYTSPSPRDLSTSRMPSSA